jgi:hypothetical protein
MPSVKQFITEQKKTAKNTDAIVMAERRRLRQMLRQLNLHNCIIFMIYMFSFVDFGNSETLLYTLYFRFT